MITIKYWVRAFIDNHDNRVLIRVRWNNKQFEVNFVTGVYAQQEKWDSDQQKAKKSTTHIVRSMKFSAAVINETVAKFRESIDGCFNLFSLKNQIPSPSQLKDIVNADLGRDELVSSTEKVKPKTLRELFDEFLVTCGRQRNWDAIAKEKYEQAYMHLTNAVPDITVGSISLDTMYQLREWYIENDYKNRTINKQVVMLKSFLRWINQQEGYTIPDEVLTFNTNLKVMSRTVTFLHYEELVAFSNFIFEDKRLDQARDLWCFMAFTSLRYSDLASLHKSDIIDNERIELYTQKTAERISVPLTEQAKAILRKYEGVQTKDGLVFNVYSNPKLNIYIKEAAEVAGLDRVVVDTYFVGMERKREDHKFYEIISCHDARRTFVSCSLAMGIPPEVVMKATGHHDYKTMKPYIATSNETQDREMSKWNRNQYRSQILAILDNADEKELKAILDKIRSMTQAV